MKGLRDGQMSKKIFLANIGANRSHSFESPVFDDGSFELLPITETPSESGPFSVRFRDLQCASAPFLRLSDYMPERMASLAAHYDPEWETFTYGDNCERSGRASNLRSVSPGDLIFFLARLCRHDGSQITGSAGFFLVGFIEIDSILSAFYEQPSPEILARVRANAHVRRAMNNDVWWDGFWVFIGSLLSRRFERAVPVDRVFCERVFLAADGTPWKWGGGRSELQTIGSYTRTCRAVISPEQPKSFLRKTIFFDHVERYTATVKHAFTRSCRM